MQAMQKRIKGEVAGQSVRFADVPKRRAAGQVHCLVHSSPCPPVTIKHAGRAQVAKQAIQKLPGGLMVKQLPKDDALKQGAAFATLAGWSLVQASSAVTNFMNSMWEAIMHAINALVLAAGTD